jgi:hypothetical protein
MTAHFLVNFFVAWAVIFFLAWGWTEVQKFSRRFAENHPEFNGDNCKNPSSEHGCVSCGMKDICGEKQ